MLTNLTVLGSVGALALLILGIAALQRRFFWVRQLAFPLYVAAGLAALEIFAHLQPAYQPEAVSRTLGWAWLFLGLITIFRLLGLYLFDVHLTARRELRLPPLLPTVAMILVYLVLEQDQFTEYDAHYFPEPSVPISRLSEPKNYSASTEPKGTTVLCAELPCDPGEPCSTPPGAGGGPSCARAALAHRPMASATARAAQWVIGRSAPVPAPHCDRLRQACCAAGRRWSSGPPRPGPA